MIGITIANALVSGLAMTNLEAVANRDFGEAPLPAGLSIGTVPRSIYTGMVRMPQVCSSGILELAETSMSRVCTDTCHTSNYWRAEFWTRIGWVVTMTRMGRAGGPGRRAQQDPPFPPGQSLP